jgi:hypothetical protein
MGFLVDEVTPKSSDWAVVVKGGKRISILGLDLPLLSPFSDQVVGMVLMWVRG